MRTTLILLAISFLLSCTSENRFISDYTFGREAILEIVVEGVSNPVDFEFYSRQGFPAQEYRMQTNIGHDTVLVLSIPSNIYDFSYLKIGGEHYNHFYTIPEDTLTVILNLDNTLTREEKISFKGSSSDICRYFEEKMENWKSTRGYDYYYDSTIFLQDFASKMDRNRDNDLEFLTEYASKNRLPDWFIITEKNNIIYETAGNKIGMIRYHRLSYDSTFQTPDGYFDFTKEIEKNNMEALLSNSYYGFLSVYFTWDSKVLESGFIGNTINCEKIMSLLEEEDIDFDPRIEDVLLGNRISLLYREKYLTPNNFQHTDSILEISEKIFHNRGYFEVVKRYRDEQHKKLKKQPTLNRGDSAPGFYLSNLNDKYIRLSDFLGKVVYLNFWSTYCSPCLASIPEKNALVEGFPKESFELVNVCLDFKPDLWSTLTEKHNFKGTHLICKGNWEQLLRENYIIQSIPHYVLIDKEGKLICNKCEKPEEIVKALNHLLK